MDKNEVNVSLDKNDSTNTLKYLYTHTVFLTLDALASTKRDL